MDTKTSSFLALAAIMVAASFTPVLAQGGVPARPATPGEPRQTIPEKVLPPSEGIQTPESQRPVPAQPPSAATGTDDTLTDKLSRGRGVLTPPAGMDPEIRVPAPEPNPGTTRVIPPPGSPANPSPVVPK